MNEKHDPIEKKHQALMNAIAATLDNVFEGHSFVLLVSNFGEGGTMNYISNSNRDDVIKMMNEFVSKADGMPS